MSLFNSVFGRGETRNAQPTQFVTMESLEALGELYSGWIGSHAGEKVTVETALSVSALSSGVNFISEQVASLPLQVFKTDEKGTRKDTEAPEYRLLHDIVNSDGDTSYKWRKSVIQNFLLTGRSYTLIERNGYGVPVNLIELDPSCVTPKRINKRRVYVYADGAETNTYDAKDIIDLVRMPKADGLNHHSTIWMNRHTIGLALAVERYASGTFASGGVPPLQLVTDVPQTSAEAGERSAKGWNEALKRARASKSAVLPMAPGSKLQPIGYDPADMQLIETKKRLDIQIAQILGLPPVFIQSLDHSTFSNTEQQGQMLVKHCLAPIIVQFQQELTAKLFPNTKQYAEFNLDGLLRGSFKERMEGFRIAGGSVGFMTINEIRALMNLEPIEGGDELFIQGANVKAKDLAGISEIDLENLLQNKAA